MGVGDKNCLLRDGTVALTANETGAPATAGTFVYDTAAGAQVPTGGVVFQTSVQGPGTAIEHSLVAAVIVPNLFPTGTTPAMTVKIQTTDDTTLAVWEDLITFGNQTVAGGLIQTSATFVAATNVILFGTSATNPGGEWRQRFSTYRRFLRHNVSAFAWTSFGGTVIRLEDAF